VKASNINIYLVCSCFLWLHFRRLTSAELSRDKIIASRSTEALRTSRLLKTLTYCRRPRYESQPALKFRSYLRFISGFFVIINIQVHKGSLFRNIEPCSPLTVNGRLEGMLPPSSGSKNKRRKKLALATYYMRVSFLTNSSTLKMESICSPDVS
jgi:hypothetical protein